MFFIIIFVMDEVSLVFVSNKFFKFNFYFCCFFSPRYAFIYIILFKLTIIILVKIRIKSGNFFFFFVDYFSLMFSLLFLFEILDSIN